MRFFPDLLDQRDKYKVEILNVRTRGHWVSNLFTLLDAVEFFSCRKLLLKFVPYQVIDTDVKDTFVGTDDQYLARNCSISPVKAKILSRELKYIISPKIGT